MDDVYNMSKCEHGERITRFCVAEHCRHKEAAGCEYCIKKHHFHLTNTPLLTETDLDAILRALSLPADGKYKSKALQELACDYLRVVKQAFVNWLEQAQTTISERLSYPLLRREGLLPAFQRIRSRDYRRLNAQDLRAIHDFAANTPSENYKKQQLYAYFAEVQQVSTILRSVEGLAQTLSRLPLLSQSEPPLPAPPIGSKLNDTLSEVLKEKGRYEAQVSRVEKEMQIVKTESYKLQELMKESSLLKNRISRELSQKEQKEGKRGSTPSKELLLDAINKKPSNNGIGKETVPSPKKEEENNAYESAEEREKKKRNRRASIDDKLEMKFGLFDRDRESKQIQVRKKFMLETIFSSKDGVVQDDEVKDAQEQPLVLADLQNSLIPPPPLLLNTNDLTVVKNKVVKIPITLPKANQQFDDEIESPIFKNKRKQGKHNHDAPLKELPLAEVTELQREDSERQLAHQPQRGSIRPLEQQVFLEKNEKNSLLLFSEALKSDGQRAIVLLVGALKYAPNNLSAAEYLSYLYLQSGRAKECLEVCESILLKIEDKAEEFEVTLHLHNNRAAALNMLGRYSESIVVLQKCLKFRRKHYFYKNLADAYFSLGIAEKAAMNYEKALRLDPAYDEAYYNLAVCEFLQSEYVSAQLNMEQALAIDPTNEVYLQLKAQINNRIANCAE